MIRAEIWANSDSGSSAVTGLGDLSRGSDERDHVSANRSEATGRSPRASP